MDVNFAPTVLFTTYEFRLQGTEPPFSQVEEEIDSELFSGDPADYASMTWELILPGKIQEHNGHSVDSATNQIAWYIDVSQPIDLYARSRTFNIWTPIIAGVVLVGLAVVGVGYVGIRRTQQQSAELSPVVTTDSGITGPAHIRKERQFSIAGMTQQQSIIIVVLAVAVVLAFCGMGTVIVWTTTQTLSSTALSPTPRPTNTVAPTTEATLTPIATALPAPVVTPSWVKYTHFTDSFSVYCPPSWQVKSEDSDGVSFEVPKFAGVDLSVGTGVDPSMSECETGDDECFLTILVSQQVEIIEATGDDYFLIHKGIWDDGVYHGYLIESKTKSQIYDTWGYSMSVVIPVEPDTMMMVFFYRVGTESITQRERETITDFVRSIRFE